MQIRMDYASCVVLLATLSGVFATVPQSPQSIDQTSISNTQSEIQNSQFLHQNLSPFASYLFKRLTSSGIFNKLFNVNFRPSQAAEEFYENAVYFTSHFGFPDTFPLNQHLSIVSEEIFSSGKITPFEFFKAISDTTEDYLRWIGYLTDNNVEFFAKLYYRTLVDSAINMADFVGPDSSLQAMTKAELRFVRELSDEISNENVVHLMSTFIGAMKRIQHSRHIGNQFEAVSKLK